MIRDQLKKDLEKTAKKPSFDGEVTVEHPINAQHGDFSTNIAMRMEGNPLENAKKLLAKWEKPDYVEKSEVAKPGFINFWLSAHAFSKELKLALKEVERYGQSKADTQGSILIEFAHPNTHKLFHIGHLRNIVLGESIAQLLKFQGNKVSRVNYQGDVGLHIAKALWGVKKLKIQKAGASSASANVKSLGKKTSFLAKAYVAGNEAYNKGEEARAQIEEINKKLYAGDKELTALWKQTREWSLHYFDRIYKRLGTKFDRLYFESEVAGPGKKIVLENVGKVFKRDDGAVIFDGEKYGLHNRVFMTSSGLPTYEGKDVGLAFLQNEEFSPDKILHVVGPEQKGYFEVLFKALEQLDPKLAQKEEHLEYGWVRLKDGKMSSREGDVVEGESVLDRAKRRLQGEYDMSDEIAEQVAVGAVKYSLLRLSPKSEIAFSIDESIRLDGESGPYLQYTYARTQGVLAKAKGKGQKSKDWKLETGNWKPNTEEAAILRHFYKFPEVTREAAEGYAPNLLCTFLYELAQKYNAFYNKHRILEAKGDSREFRLALTEVVGNILKSGLNLLGIEAPERM